MVRLELRRPEQSNAESTLRGTLPNSAGTLPESAIQVRLKIIDYRIWKRCLANRTGVVGGRSGVLGMLEKYWRPIPGPSRWEDVVPEDEYHPRLQVRCRSLRALPLLHGPANIRDSFFDAPSHV